MVIGNWYTGIFRLANYQFPYPFPKNTPFGPNSGFCQLSAKKFPTDQDKMVTGTTGILGSLINNFRTHFPKKFPFGPNSGLYQLSGKNFPTGQNKMVTGITRFFGSLIHKSPICNKIPLSVPRRDFFRTIFPNFGQNRKITGVFDVDGSQFHHPIVWFGFRIEFFRGRPDKIPHWFPKLGANKNISLPRTIFLMRIRDGNFLNFTSHRLG